MNALHALLSQGGVQQIRQGLLGHQQRVGGAGLTGLLQRLC